VEKEYKEKEAEEQLGFTAGRSTIDNAICTIQLNLLGKIHYESSNGQL
jgi:hypothetical protein